MQVTTFYVDSSVTPAVPVFASNQMTPFGEDIGGTNSTWTNWEYGVPKAELFNFQDKANCPEANNCNSNQNQARRARQQLIQTFAKYH
eukprot:CAMPEP_0202503730 /NCGR_PEP_ID=MMETSP1361-20130828/42578_1 /ASSEMBLY_ACC=CAM_ASM_000849 /TAXON_ID=210615 /ORGANISM="Staurosira complex sp., Strain CCMP2646" /LENGTH=87 /DNA_ID=CAMNT_0049137053 /DNA_START=1 /DNA_END=261 /DNA_ORIENTATION=-